MKNHKNTLLCLSIFSSLAVVAAVWLWFSFSFAYNILMDRYGSGSHTFQIALISASDVVFFSIVYLFASFSWRTLCQQQT